MKKPRQHSTSSNIAVTNDPFRMRDMKDPFSMDQDRVHVYGRSRVCATDTRGFATPGNRDPREIVVDASEGFIPLWAQGNTLRWRFEETSMACFEDPAAAKQAIRQLLVDSIMEWGPFTPISFKEDPDAWDFEIVLCNADDCDASGCVLASAFFPDGGRHELTLYPKMFKQSRTEQVGTLIHELGHVFGLRHFFANVSESAYPSVVFGKHGPFTIMNYGSQSKLTDADRSDLRKLYTQVWNGELTAINGTPVVQVIPYHNER